MNITESTQNGIQVTGRSIIAGEPVFGTHGEHQAINPFDGHALEPVFGLVGAVEVDQAAQAAWDCFDEYRALDPERRAQFLEAIAAELEGSHDVLVARAVQETGLTNARISGEIARTVGQLRLFAREIRLGAFHQIRHDTAQPDRLPLPRPDIKFRRIPIGPVVVFGASNFPLAFSTAGGDTASALAAGCPVIVKGHSAHAGTAELAGQAITRAAKKTLMPPGVFSLVFGSGREVGQQLAAHPAVAAIAFTGSQAGGLALMETAANREVPIPVFAEMSSINPVITSETKAQSDPKTEAEGFVASLTLGSGQFCTNPGLLFVPAGADSLINQVRDTVAEANGQTMLTSTISDSYSQGLTRLSSSGAIQISQGKAGSGLNAPAPVVFQTDAVTLANTRDLHEEVFGAAAIIVTYHDVKEVITAMQSLGGQLTSTLRITDQEEDADFVNALLPTLERCSGRIIINGWPTGVEVVDSMVHGGPFPATSDSRATSVGTYAIERFLRPVAYQNFPEQLTPEILLDSTQPRRIDGELFS